MLMWFSYSQRYGVHDLCSLVLEDAGDNYLGMTPGVESTSKKHPVMLQQNATKSRACLADPMFFCFARFRKSWLSWS